MRNSPVYYGWYVLAASAASEMLTQGATSYASGLFVLPLQAEFHISRAAANLPVLILFAGAVLIAPLVGRILDARPIRSVMLAGAVLLGLSFGGIAAAHSLAIMAAILLFRQPRRSWRLGRSPPPPWHRAGFTGAGDWHRGLPPLPPRVVVSRLYRC